MDLGLKNKVALVFGAGGGLGGAIARSLAGEGARVAVADIAQDAAQQTVSAIHESGGEAIAVDWDLAKLDIIDARIKEIEGAFGPIDILVNNTGGPKPTPVAGQDADTWTDYFQSMILSVIAVTDKIVPGMRERKWGRVITSTSSGVISPIPNLGVSNTLRSALHGWSKTLAGEVAGDGVTCNVILPGRIATDRILFLDEQKAKREGRTPEEVARESCAAIPVGRYGDPQEYGDMATFLASARASYINGSVIRVDGGYIGSI